MLIGKFERLRFDMAGVIRNEDRSVDGSELRMDECKNTYGGIKFENSLLFKLV